MGASMRKDSYPSDLTDKEWAVIKPLIPGPSRLGRPPRYPKRRVLDAIFYLVRSGIAWRMMPKDLPPWRICYHYFSKWKDEGVWESLHDKLRDFVRYRSGKKKPRLLRSSTLRASRLLATAEFAAMMQERRLREESGIYSWTVLDSCSSQWCTARRSRTGMERGK